MTGVPASPRPAVTRAWGVDVNEARIISTRSGVDWWSHWRQRMERAGRITILVASMGGDRVIVACDSKDDATWLAGHMTGFAGIPKSAVKVAPCDPEPAQ